MDPQQYFDQIEQHRKAGTLEAALMLALECLNRFPDNNRARLLLARVFYALGFIHSATREVELLHERLPGSESVSKLLEELSPGSTAAKPFGDHDITVAEDEVSIDDINLDDDN